MPLVPGTRIGQYEIVTLLGAGGMGEVYRARDARLQRDVAIKIVRDLAAGGPDRVTRFRREAQVLASLNHPHIGAIYGVEDVGESGALVLELVDGPTLADRIARGPIPLEEAIPIARQIGDALAAAHDQGVIHRDLKPANIKLRPDGTVKVLDFGLAKVFADESSASEPFNSPTLSLGATHAGVILGTAAYMSPEQARGKTVDKRTDVWAFGCVLYEMLAGRRAFAGDEVSDTLAFVITRDVEWDALPKETPAGIRRLLRRCLEKDRARRLRDVGDASLDLNDLSGATEAGPASGTDSRARRRSIGVGLAGLTAGAAAAAAILLLARSSQVVPLRDTDRFAIVPPANAAVGATVYLRTLAVSPDGRRIVYLTVDGRLMMRALDRLDVAPLLETGLPNAPFFSPDGNSVAFFTVGTSEMYRMPIAGGPTIPVTRSVGVSRGAVWLADDTIVFATTAAATGLLRVPSSGGDPKTITVPDTKAGEIDHVWPEALPGGRAVLFTVVSAGGVPNAQIAAVDLQTGVRKNLLRGGTNAVYLPTGHLLYSAGGSMRIVLFDADRLEVRGDPVPVPEPMTVSSVGAVNASVSRDGTLAYVPGAGMNAAERSLIWVDRTGHEERIDTPALPFAVPRVSPDGSRVVTHLDSDTPDVVVSDLRRHNQLRLTFGKSPSIRPLWSADGKWVFFRSDTDGPAIYRKSSDGGGAIERVTPVVGDGSIHAMTPDGKKIIYAQISQATSRDLWMVDVDGKEKPQPLVVEPGDQANAVISPDGRWLAYHASEVGEIYVRPFPNVADGKWQLVTKGAKWPLWSRDGKELFYVAARGIMSILVDTSTPAFHWGTPTLLVEASYSSFPGLAGPRNYDQAPDGRFLVIKESQATTPAALVVVKNWFEEIRRLAPGRP
jgi:eukaryotic-like serine/threonine-protein kinase